MNPTQKKIHKLIKSNKDPELSAAKIADRLGISRQVVSDYISRMLKNGLLVRQPVWRVTEKTLLEYLRGK